MKIKHILFFILALVLTGSLLFADPLDDSMREMESIDSQQLQEVNQEEDEMQMQQIQEVQESEIPHDWD